jgi:hypothetical protein
VKRRRVSRLCIYFVFEDMSRLQNIIVYVHLFL